MKNAVLIRGARQLLTLRGSSVPRRGTALRELGLIPEGAVLIRDGRIFAVGQGRRVENLAEARHAVEIDATRRVILPGFVDSHTHLVSGPPRLDDYESGIYCHDRHAASGIEAGILSSVRAVHKTPASSLERQARSLVGLFIRNGTTTLEATSGYGLDRTGEMKTLKVLAKLDQSPLDVIPTYFGVHAVPPGYDGTPHDYIDRISAEMLPRIGRQRLARFVDVCCERGVFLLDDARRLLEAARGLGFGLKIHAEQFSHSGSVRLAVELGAISADHLDHVDQNDVAILAQSSTIATLIPGAVFHMGADRYAPARALIDQGVAVALATGFNPRTSPTWNMQMILSLACTQMRMTPVEAISAATINGAHALGCADRCGSLEAGKYADLTLFDVPDYREIPYRFGVNQVALTMKKGIVLYRRTGVGCPENL